MKVLIRYLKLSGIFLGIILLMSILFGFLNLVGLSHKVSSILNVIGMVLLFLILGIIEGMNASQKGFVAGFKIGLYLLMVLILLNLIIFQSNFGLSRIIYYVILLFSSVFGAMIGINRKKKE